MSHQGRCFRDRRRTTRRKARQDAAIAVFKRLVPAQPVRFGAAPNMPMTVATFKAVHFGNLDAMSKQRLVEGYKKIQSRGVPRRRGMM